MSNSPLVHHTHLSPNYNRRQNKIKKITIHHMAGNLSVEACGNVFAPVSRQASSNYGVDSKGRVGMYVEEHNRAWTSSSPENDHQAITIEVANDQIGGNWHVSDTALEKTIQLCVDICKRNGIKSLNYTGDTKGNLTRHDMFANTNCPGPYLGSKFPYIASEVNKRLKGGTSTTPTTPSTSNPKVKTGYVEVIYGGSDGLVLHTKPSWDKKTESGVVKKGEVFTIVDGQDVDGVWQYKIKSGKWITSAPEYVKYRKTIGTSKPKPKKKTLYLPKSATSWNVYPLNKAPIIGNEIGKLNPSLFGGLQYEVLDTPQTDVVTIQTRDFGKVNIYVAKSTGAVIK